jgi:hypothetical protein
MALGKPLHLRLFLEGLEVPVIGAQVSMNTNGAGTAAIQVIPLDAVMDLKPRTMVHLFYLDPRTSVDGEKWPYRLLFMGEVHGFSMQQTPMSRACVLQCLDFSSYWDSAKATAIEYGPWGNVFTHNANMEHSNVSAFDNLANHQVERLLSWIGQTPLTPGLQKVGGLAGGIIRMLEAMSGVPGAHKGINDFFTVAQLRCRILEQLIAEENDNTARQLLGNQVLDEWLKNGIQNQGGNVSFRDMLLLLFKYIYYESVPITTPFFTDAKSGESTWVPGTPTALASGKTGQGIVSLLRGRKEAIKSHTQVTREWTENLSSMLAAVVTTCTQCQKSLEKLKMGDNGVSKDIPLAIKEIESAKQILIKIKPPGTDSTGTAISGDSFATPDSSGHQKLKMAFVYLETAIAHIQGSREKGTTSGHYNTDAVTQRVRTQIIRPDCWFAVPPACNVIFPEHYTTLNFDRIWSQEATRLLVLAKISLIDQGNDLENRLLATRVMAPFVGNSSGSLTGTADDNNSYRTLMPHEYHVGINAREEWLPDTNSIQGVKATAGVVKGENLSWSRKIALFHFFKYRFAPRQASLGGRFNPYVVCGFPAVIIRRPIVPLKDMDPNATEQQLLDSISNQPEKYDIPYQLVGMVSSVHHSIDQNGGVTNVSMHSVRRHSSSDDEFLGLIGKFGNTSTERVVRDTFNYHQLAEIKDERKLKLLRRLTPQREASSTTKVTGSTIEQKTINTKVSTAGAKGKTQKQQSQSVSTTKELDIPGAPTPKYTARRPIPGISENPVLVPHPPGDLTIGKEGYLPDSSITGIEVVAKGDTAVHEVVGSDGKVTARYFLDVVVHSKINIVTNWARPVEEMIRPDWFSPTYQNTRIGTDIYAKFFGCGSIVDNLEAKRTTVTPAVGTPVVEDGTGTVLVEQVRVEAAAAQNLSVEKAINAIAFVYGQIKADPNLDADDFIERLIYRPIASMTDILGDENLHYDASGEPLPGRGEEGEPKDMRVGFHSGSINPDAVKLKNLKGLLKDPTTGLPRINGVGSPSAVDPALDVRWEKQAQVTAYVAQLVKSHGLLG